MRAKLLLGLTLLTVLSVVFILNGCARTVLHPIDKVDIIAIAEGATLTAPKDGWFLSDLYLEKVVKARVK